MPDSNESYGLCLSADNLSGRWNPGSCSPAGCLATFVRTLQWKLLREYCHHNAQACQMRSL
ncbi:hypothetical protein DAI22_07g075500 [Oryza sativa Japonica Group]|nr:hypothetical protein DAI22_07g075500 [Oryza sativa Japonica Group]